MKKPYKLFIWPLVIVLLTLHTSLISALGQDHFSSPVAVSPSLPIAGASTNPKIADVNIDGNLDIVTIDKSTGLGILPGYLAVRLGNGDGTFNSVKTSDLASGNPTYRNDCCRFEIAKFTNDAIPDAAVFRQVSSSNSGVLELHAGNGDGTFQVSPSQVIPTPMSLQTFYVTDLNNDGYMDVVLSFGSVNMILTNDGSGQFIAQNINIVVSPNTSAVIFAVADFTGDQLPDLMASIPSSSHGAIWAGNGNGNFTLLNQTLIGAGSGSSWARPTAGDFTGDGIPDVVVMHAGTNTGAELIAIRVYENLGSGTFSTEIRSPRIAIGGQLIAEDINNDSKLDLVSHDSVNQMSIYLGDGEGHFLGEQILSLGSNSLFVQDFGDINNDGNPDIALGAHSLNPVYPRLAFNINPPADSTAPQVQGIPQASANANGWYSADVLINWLATDPLPSSGSPTQPAPILASTEGTNIYESGQSCDPAGNCATGNITISIDKSVPIITGALDRTANAQNWFNTDVTATFTCSDAISGVASCTAPVLINNEGQGQSVQGAATDKADNTASMTFADINIDKTLPSIGYALSAPANVNGWHNQDVEVSFICSDGLSGLLLCSLPTTVTTEGQGQTFTGTAFDNADNTQSVTATLNIDKTMPLITYGLSEAANQYGWHNQDVTVDFICIDGLSGIMACPEPVTLVSEETSQSVSGSTQDFADNSASVTTAGINIDKTAPNITANVSTPPNSGGWNSGAVTITFTCSDELSGIDTCSSPVTISEEGQNQVVTGTAVDKAGNVSTTTATISIDATKPTIVATQTPPANNNGWNNSNVTVSFVCSDALSGIAACSGPVTITTDGQNQSVSGTAMDNAGNSNTVTANINIDRVAPVTGDISASTTFLLAAGNVTINTSVSDALSGISKVEYYVDSDPGLGNGMPMSISGSTASATVAVPSGPLANHTINVRTRDNAGNWSPIKSVTIFVLL